MTLLSLVPVIWLAIVLAAVFCEAAMQNLVAVWCAPAAAAALLGGIFGMTVRGQCVIFVVTALILIALAQLIRAGMQRHNEKFSGKDGR